MEEIPRNEHPLIHFREGATVAGRPEIPVVRVEAAARYYGEHADEIDALIERARLAVERKR